MTLRYSIRFRNILKAKARKLPIDYFFLFSKTVTNGMSGLIFRALVVMFLFLGSGGGGEAAFLLFANDRKGPNQSYLI